MDDQIIKTVTEHIDVFGNKIEQFRSKNMMIIKNEAELEKIPTSGGCYWIATAMPIDKFDSEKFEKKMRLNTPMRTKIIKQDLDDKYYIIYNGTEGNLRKRIGQHLFNQGHEKTGKLGLVIDQDPYNKYEWYIYWYEIDDVILRNAMEIWWRYRIGWPVFCKR